MRLSLIGMAGSGKSHWSRKLAAKGFQRFCCDDRIEEKLAPELTSPAGTSLRPGPWMGFPWEPTYAEREARYLCRETEVLAEIVHTLKNQTSGREPVVVDTTGSLVYASQEILATLRELTVMVYLPVPAEFRASLLEAYRSHPHPLVWHGMFDQKPGESEEAALDRCYAKLVSSREQLYERIADVWIDFYQRRKRGCTTDHFLSMIQDKTASKDQA